MSVGTEVLDCQSVPLLSCSHLICAQCWMKLEPCQVPCADNKFSIA